MPGATAVASRSTANSARSPGSTVLAPGRLVATSAPGRVKPLARGSAWPPWDRCSPATAQADVPVFSSVAVSRPVGTPGSPTRVGAVDCTVVRLPALTAAKRNHEDRRPSLLAGQVRAL